MYDKDDDVVVDNRIVVVAVDGDDIVLDGGDVVAVAGSGVVAAVVVDILVAVDHRRCHAPYGSNSVVDIYDNNCVQLCGRFIKNVLNEIKNKYTETKICCLLQVVKESALVFLVGFWFG